jgi:hypothetical protein
MTRLELAIFALKVRWSDDMQAQHQGLARLERAFADLGAPGGDPLAPAGPDQMAALQAALDAGQQQPEQESFQRRESLIIPAAARALEVWVDAGTRALTSGPPQRPP